jgi:zinc transporter, ZIP family
MNPVIWSLLTLFSTSAGGLCALWLRHRMHLVLGFTAGVLLGVVAFDLVPESLAQAEQLGHSGQVPMAALAIGFLLFHTLQRLARGHRHDGGHERHAHPQGRPVPSTTTGLWATSALIVHSFFDGVGIGIAFQAAPALGATVATAVIAHDFCDGLNTVGLMLKHRHTTARALAMLALDALAPLLGVAAASVVSLPPGLMAPLLGGLAGFLLCIVATHLVPEATRAKHAAATAPLGLALLGASLAYFVARAAG